MAVTDEALRWRGRTIIDRDGDKIGKLEEIYLDDRTDEPKWGTVQMGLLGRKTTFVPLDGATADGDDVRVNYEKAIVKDAPDVGEEDRLTPDQEDELYRHYGLGAGGGGADTDRGYDDRDRERDREYDDRDRQRDREYDDRDRQRGHDDPTMDGESGYDDHSRGDDRDRETRDRDAGYDDRDGGQRGYDDSERSPSDRDRDDRDRGSQGGGFMDKARNLVSGDRDDRDRDDRDRDDDRDLAAQRGGSEEGWERGRPTSEFDKTREEKEHVNERRRGGVRKYTEERQSSEEVRRTESSPIED